MPLSRSGSSSTDTFFNIQPRHFQNYLENHFRISYSGGEIDYDFPIDYHPFYQQVNRRPENPQLAKKLNQEIDNIQTYKICSESQALALFLEQVKPDLLGLMHNEHAGGTYQFTSHKPSQDLVAAFDLSNKYFDTPAHLGERPDPWPKWHHRNDYMREVTLKERLKSFAIRFKDIKGRKIIGPVSVGQYMESIKPECQVLTPEIGLWWPEDIDDSSPSNQTRLVTYHDNQYYSAIKFPDGETRIIAYPKSIQVDKCSNQEYIKLSRKMLWQESIEIRNWTLEKLKDLLLKNQDSLDLKSREVKEVKSELKYARETMFKGKDRTIRKSEQVDLEARWSLQNALIVGHSIQMYRNYNLKQAESQSKILLKQVRSCIGEMQIKGLNQKIRSIVSRLLLSQILANKPES
jgi:hypothetical protein